MVRGGYRGKYRSKPRNQGGRGEEEEESSDEEQKYQPRSRQMGAQASTVGMLPPSDSEEEEGEGEGGGEKPKEKPAEKKPAEKKPAEKPKDKGGSSKKKDESESEEDDSEDDSDSSDDAPVNDYLTAPRQPKKVVTEERDPEQIRKDLERLELIRKKREDDRQKRIRDEGWDRFAPVSDTNRPPGYVPSDHPSHGKEGHGKEGK